MKWSSQHFALITSDLSLFFLCSSHSLRLPFPLPWFFTLHFLPEFLFESFLVPLQFSFFLSINSPSISLCLSLSFMPSSLPLHVGCVICKCADSCSRSPSFDSAVAVINGSANCDSSQTRWEQLCQPVSTLSFYLFCGLFSVPQTHIVGYLLRRLLKHWSPKLTLKQSASSPSSWLEHYLPSPVSGFSSSFHPVIFLLLSLLFSTTPSSNFSAPWPSLSPQAYLSL